MKKIKKVSILADVETNIVDWCIEIILEDGEILLLKYPKNNWMSTAELKAYVNKEVKRISIEERIKKINSITSGT